MAKITDFATVTTKTLQVYANGSTGNDSNDGLTVGTPKLTLGAVFALVPDIVKHNVCVNLAGTFNEPGDINFSRMIQDTGFLLVDGGSTTTTLAGPYTANIHETYSIGLTTAGWTVDAHKGYTVSVTSGPCNGEKRTIQSNTATTITPVKDFSADPGAATFVIERPTTTISASSADAILKLAMYSNAVTRMAFRLQRLYMSGTKAALQYQGMCRAFITNFISDSTAASGFYPSSFTGLGNVRQNPATFADIADTIEYVGFCNRVAATNLYSAACYFYGCYFAVLTATGCTNLVYLAAGTRINGGAFAFQLTSSRAWIASAAGYAKVKIGGASTYGVYAGEQSYIWFGDYVELSNNSYVGLMLINSTGWIGGTTSKLAGSSNGSWGAYIDVGGRLFLTSGATPTLTGTSGECAIPTGTGATWVNINGGTVLSDAAYAALVRKY